MTTYRSVVVDRFPLTASPAALFAQLPPAPGRFLLESAGGPADIARWSFFGHRPFLTLRVTRGDVRVETAEGATCRQANPFDMLDDLLAAYRVECDPTLPPFPGGLAGYVAYDAGRYLERLPATAADDQALPEMLLGAYDAVAAVDHAAGEVWVITLPLPGPGRVSGQGPAPGEEALAAARELAALIRACPGELPRLGESPAAVTIASNFTTDEYQRAVARAIEYIYAGDIFQVNLAQRFTAPLPVPSWELYVRLRQINPAPFAAFLDYGDFQVVSASPERFLLATPPGASDAAHEGVRVETRPIKGTRPRGKTPAQDEAMRAELQESLKDRSELNMIVDLERNDLGRVCRFGTVKVPDARRMEAYPTVFHTVATVEGHLRPDVTPGGLLKATFPGGSITGAPKIRAMAIIEELERLRRGIYCGSIGYLSFAGAIDLSIVIRTLICKGGQVTFHAGGGIVADSDPKAEYDETLDKARALMNALLGRASGSEGSQ